jgi:hypothetical protein
MKRTLDLVILTSLVASLALMSGCVAAGAQIRESYAYSSETYDAARASPATDQEVLDLLAQDTTDENLWIEGVYECGHFAADLWWNAYTQGLEACMVWVTYREQGKEQVHWLVEFHIEVETQSYWLWVDPQSDKIVDEGAYTIQDTFCGQEAFSLCKTWWEGNLS